MIKLSEIKRFWRDETAGMITLSAFMLPAILGFAGLGMDVSGWYMERRDVQNLTDMAAIDTVHSGNNFTDADLQAQVSTFLNDRGFDPARDTLTLNTPPSQGDYAGQTGFYEIIVSRNVELTFLSAFYAITGNSLTVNVSGRAVAGTLIIGTQCVVALDDTEDRALNFSGSTIVGTDCGVASNSVSEQAIYIGGNAELDTVSVQTVGDIEVSGGGVLTSDSPPQSLSTPADDPYTSLPIPTDMGCDVSGNTNVGDNDVMTPGRYCGNLRIQGENIVFEPGVYVIEGGDLIANANSEFSGEGVTFIFTGDTAGDVGSISMNGSATATLSAPTTDGDTYEGILVYQDPIADYRSAGVSAIFNGGVNLMLDGVIYMPRADITFTGGAQAEPSCLQVWGATVTFSGDSVIGNDDTICESMNLETSPQFRIMLVE
ncbi:pilus assembly protein TadG-related protein [Kordiimonas lipolytica]|uniref:Pilus assembly protein TadG-related protein n=1 Tax=Kordiimonas lipolytica TaxID=1662421 RepID=A0ABV8UCV3_9PROT|nr:Tad domain-containing protein [Kordiimonas lipolytica]